MPSTAAVPQVQTRADLLTRRSEIDDRLTEIRNEVILGAKARGQSELPAAVGVEIDALTAERTGLELKLARIEDQRGGYEHQVRIGHEAHTYTRESAQQGVSFFADMFAQVSGGVDFRAQERLQRHQSEVRVDGQTRAVSTSSAAGLIPPQYLIDQATTIARAGRPLANLLTRLPLPADGMSLVIPRGTTGASSAIQNAENAGVSSTDMVWANLTVPVVTIAGMQDLSRQTLERGANSVDTLVFADLAAAYAVALDSQIISGTGSAGQLLGLLNTTGITQLSAFSAAVTVASFYSKIAGAINSIETTRYMAPDQIVMHPRRWSWLMAQLDGQSRPLAVPNINAPQNSIAGDVSAPVDVPSVRPVGWLFGLPVVTDASIPTNVGAAAEDIIIVMRRSDHLIWEDGDGSPTELRFEQPLANSLAWRLVSYGYAAATWARWVTGVAVIGGNSTAGNGLVGPSF